MSLDNLRQVLAQADAIDWTEGKLAYLRYHQVMAKFANHYGFTMAQTTAAFVALSPNNDYRGNLKSMATLLHGIRAGWPLAKTPCSTYRACQQRAWLYATGRAEFLDHARGPKTRSFYANIMAPSESPEVTVDGHLIAAWLGRRMTMKEAVISRVASGVGYDQIAAGVRELAAGLTPKLAPCQVQAVLWFTWKRMHRVISVEQLGLFAAGDQWRTMVDPADLGWWPRRLAASQGRLLLSSEPSQDELWISTRGIISHA